MTRAAEMLARLNPSTCRFDMGNGGIPDLTNIDIAGALGMVRNQLGRELMAVIHWSAAAPGSMDRVRGIMVKRLLDEGATRWRECVDAELRSLTADNEHDVRAARASHDRAKQRLFASDAGRMMAVVNSALHEIATPNHCSVCAGRGQIIAGALVVTCEPCCGSGKRSHSTRDRATRIGVNESQLRRQPGLSGMHDWCVSLMQSALIDAERELRNALAKEEAVA